MAPNHAITESLGEAGWEVEIRSSQPRGPREESAFTTAM